MDIAALLYPLLSAGAALAATEAVKAVGKSAATDAYDALKTRLRDTFGVRTVDLIDGVTENPALEPAIRADLARPEIVRDDEIRELATTLKAAIDAIPADDVPRYALDVRKAIEAVRDVNLRDIEGIRAESISAGQDLILENIKAPPGKP